MRIKHLITQCQGCMTLLTPLVQLCDVISKWEQAMRSQSQGKLDTSRIIKLTYKNR